MNCSADAQPASGLLENQGRPSAPAPARRTTWHWSLEVPPQLVFEIQSETLTRDRHNDSA